MSVSECPHCVRAGIGEKKVYLPLTALTTAFLVLASALAAALPFANGVFSNAEWPRAAAHGAARPLAHNPIFPHRVAHGRRVRGGSRLQ